MRPATSRPARRARSRMSRTRPRLRFRPRWLRARPARPTTTTPRSRALPRQARRSGSTRRRAAPAARLRPAPLLPSHPRLHDRGRRRSSTHASRQRRPTQPETCPAARRARSPMSRTRPPLRFRPRSLRARRVRPTTTTPRSRALPRQARRCGSTRPQAARAAPPQRAPRPPSRAPASRSPSPTTARARLSRQPPPTRPATSRPARPARSPTSRTRRRPRLRPRSLRARLGPANDNNPEITGTAEAGSTVTRVHDCRLHRRRCATGTAAAFASPGFTIAVADDSSTTFKATATDAAGNVSGCSASSVTYVEDSTAPAPPDVARFEPGSACQRQQPRDHGHRRGRLDGQGLHDRGLHRRRRCNRHRGGLRSPRLHDRRSPTTARPTFKATATDAAGNVSACSARSVTYVEDSTAPALPASLASSPAGPANDNNPEITGTAEAGSTVRVYTTAGCTGGAAATGTAAAFSSPGLTIAVADDSSTTFKATATDAAGNVSACSASSVTYVEDSTAPALPTSLASSPGRPGERQQPGDHGHRRGRLDGQGLHDRRLHRRRRLQPALRPLSPSPASRRGRRRQLDDFQGDRD